MGLSFSLSVEKCSTCDDCDDVTRLGDGGTQSDVTHPHLNFPARGQAAVLSLAVTKHLARGCLLADVTTSMCKHAGDNEKN